MADIDAEKIRMDFPILSMKKDGKRLVYLDSAATSQKPRQVIEAIDRYYNEYNANIHRGVYKISEEATSAYEESKRKVASLIGASGIEEIVYVRNATEAINIVALSWADANIGKGDRILVTEMEHHSNIVPWQILSKKKGAELDYIKVDAETGRLDKNSMEEQLSKKPKLLAITHASNVLGTINDIRVISKMAHDAGATVLVDGAQSVPHIPVKVSDLGCDFMAFSGHKMLAPTGIGVLYGRKDILEKMPPAFGGGDMIRSVDHQSFTSNDLPWKFEAGTPNIEGGIGLGVAIDYLNEVGMENVKSHESSLTAYALQRLDEAKVRTFGPKDPNSRVGAIPFEIDGVHPHDVATIFDSENVAIRAGHHCAMPLVVEVLKKPSVSRMSFYIYNTKEDIDRAIEAVAKVRKIFKMS
jgi:cysteine desulfurase/selenocysteine lyase